MQESNEIKLDEWKAAMENARHFNDLLIRFRMLGLPMVITLSVAAIVSGQFVNEIEMWKWFIPVIALCISISALIALILHTIKKCKFSYKEEHEIKQAPPLPIYWFEFILWLIFILIILCSTVVNIYVLLSYKESLAFSNTTSYSLVPIGLIIAVVLLIALYAMDRFYYYKLLIGVVSRLVVLEESLGFNITDTTSKFMSRKYATNLITFFYFLPGIVLLVISCASLN